MKHSISIASPLTALGLALALAATGFSGHAAGAPRDSQTTQANVTRLTTSLVERSQFAHHPFDRELAGTLLDRYLDSLDGARSLLHRDATSSAPARRRRSPAYSSATRRDARRRTRSTCCWGASSGSVFSTSDATLEALLDGIDVDAAPRTRVRPPRVH